MIPIFIQSSCSCSAGRLLLVLELPSNEQKGGIHHVVHLFSVIIWLWSPIIKFSQLLALTMGLRVAWMNAGAREQVWLGNQATSSAVTTILAAQTNGYHFELILLLSWLQVSCAAIIGACSGGSNFFLLFRVVAGRGSAESRLRRRLDFDWAPPPMQPPHTRQSQPSFIAVQAAWQYGKQAGRSGRGISKDSNAARTPAWVPWGHAWWGPMRERAAKFALDRGADKRRHLMTTSKSISHQSRSRPGPSGPRPALRWARRRPR